MWIAFSLFLQYSYILGSVQCETGSRNDKSFPAIPNMPESIGTEWLGSGHPKTWARATLQLAIREF
jgi:hypothetical protein